MDDRKNKERQLFSDALDLPASERLPFLKNACQDDSLLLQRVQDLLDAYCNESRVLKTAVAQEGENTAVEEAPGTSLGRYKLLQKIGEGGMGIVYMAEQTDPVVRKVALKIIKWGMDTKNVVARFEAERQALAMMDHPNIAKVLDAGATKAGRPYFVMELVQGIPITKYCEENRLNIKERIQLLISVCQAIQSAHHKGIIHRDIKPSNVLVSFLHGESTVKVIDFGIAKATNQKLTEKTLFTNFATMIGTPAYMSPEQAKMSVIDIDTRTDVYSLGVLIYELLSGSTPFPEKRLRSMGYAEIQRVIADEEPEKPSTRISKTFAASKTSGKHTPPGNIGFLNSSIDADLDWITMKCLEKDRRRRYNTVSALGDDLQRHLNDEPVDAAAPTFSYQLAKLYRRHQAYARLVMGSVLLLLVATVFSSYQAVRASRLSTGLKEEVDYSNRMRKEAEELGKLETELRAAAEKQALRNRRQTYAADINLVKQMLEKNNLGRARSLHARHKPKTGEIDLRGWEWRYLAQFCRTDEVRTLAEFDNEIRQLEISNDGRWLLVGTLRPSIYSLWDLENNRHVRDFDGEQVSNFLFRPVFSTTDPLMVWSKAEKTDDETKHLIEIINVETQVTVQQINSDYAAAFFRFSPDGSLLLGLSCYTNKSFITVWNIRTGEQVSQSEGPAWGGLGLYGHPYDIAKNLDSVIYTHKRGWISKYSVSNQAEQWSAKVSDELVVSVALSSDEETLAVGEGYDASAIYLYDYRTGTLKGKFDAHQAWASRLYFLDGGKTLVSASADQTIRLWSTENFEPLRTLRGHRNEIRDLVLVPGANRMLSAGKDQLLKEWNNDLAEQNSHVIELRGQNWSQWQFSDDEKTIHVLDKQGQLQNHSGSSFKDSTLDIRFNSNASSLLFNFEEQAHIAIGSKSGHIEIYHLQSGNLHSRMKLADEPAEPHSFDGTRLLKYRLVESKKYHLLDLLNPTRKIDIEMNRIGFPAPGDNDVPTWGYQFDRNLISIGRIADREIIPFENGKKGFLGAHFTPDGEFLLMAHHPGVISKWKYDIAIEAPQLLAEYSGALMGYRYPIVSKDYSRLFAVSGGRDALSIWDFQSDQLLLSLESHRTSDSPPQISHTERMVGRLSTFGDMLTIWQAPTFTEIEEMERVDERKRTPFLSRN